VDRGFYGRARLIPDLPPIKVVTDALGLDYVEELDI
jgi:hypothetical protein